LRETETERERERERETLYDVKTEIEEWGIMRESNENAGCSSHSNRKQ